MAEYWVHEGMRADMFIANAVEKLESLELRDVEQISILSELICFAEEQPAEAVLHVVENEDGTRNFLWCEI